MGMMSHQIHFFFESHIDCRLIWPFTQMAKLSMWFSLLGAFQCHPRVYAVKHQLLEDLLPKKKKLRSGKHYSNIKIPELYTRE